MITHEALGVLAGIVAFSACPVYILGILRGETKPDRVTWWVIGFVSGMIALTSYAAGATWTVWLPVGYTLSFLTIALFSLKYGDGPFALHALDRVSLAGASLSAVVWLTSGNPVIALAMNICTEFIGVVPTIYKSYIRPLTENRTAWVITTVASAINLFAVDQWTFAIAAYPIYVFTTNTLITIPLVLKKSVRL